MTLRSVHYSSFSTMVNQLKSGSLPDSVTAHQVEKLCQLLSRNCANPSLIVAAARTSYIDIFLGPDNLILEFMVKFPLFATIPPKSTFLISSLAKFDQQLSKKIILTEKPRYFFHKKNSNEFTGLNQCRTFARFKSDQIVCNLDKSQDLDSDCIKDLMKPNDKKVLSSCRFEESLVSDSTDFDYFLVKQNTQVFGLFISSGSEIYVDQSSSISMINPRLTLAAGTHWIPADLTKTTKVYFSDEMITIGPTSKNLSPIDLKSKFNFNHMIKDEKHSIILIIKNFFSNLTFSKKYFTDFFEQLKLWWGSLGLFTNLFKLVVTIITIIFCFRAVLRVYRTIKNYLCY